MLRKFLILATTLLALTSCQPHESDVKDMVASDMAKHGTSEAFKDVTVTNTNCAKQNGVLWECSFELAVTDVSDGKTYNSSERGFIENGKSATKCLYSFEAVKIFQLSQYNNPEIVKALSDDFRGCEDGSKIVFGSGSRSLFYEIQEGQLKGLTMRPLNKYDAEFMVRSNLPAEKITEIACPTIDPSAPAAPVTCKVAGSKTTADPNSAGSKIKQAFDTDVILKPGPMQWDLSYNLPK